MATADLTGDGNLDLIVEGSVTMSFLGDGKGNFTQAGSYAAVGYPLIADINGDGKPDLLLGIPGNSLLLLGNGDGTFSGIPGTALSGSGLSGDVNDDGIADIVFVSGGSSENLSTALGRGDGTFAVLNQDVPLPASNNGPYSILLGDFNGDGKLDTMAVQAGTPSGCSTTSNAQQDALLYSYLGNGNGGFQLTGTSLDLGIAGVNAGAFGDFNGDGNLDLLLSYFGCTQAGLVFLPGHGDGTFGSPVAFSATTIGTSSGSNLLVGDLNNDKKLDFIWTSNSAVYLGNGDGTFRQISLNLSTQSAQPLALGDVNGDGILDLVVGSSIYAGNGDGTFQTTPLYTLPSSYATATIVLTSTNPNPSQLTALFVPVVTITLPDGYSVQFPTPVASAIGTANALAAALNTSASPVAAVVNSGGTRATASVTLTAKVVGADQDGPITLLLVDAVTAAPASMAGGDGAAQVASAAIGDVNGDGNPDLLEFYLGPLGFQLSVSLGDGHGNFTQDTNTYLASSVNQNVPSSFILTRLNNQAPSGSQDHTPDVLASTGGVIFASMLNQLNPAPGKLAPINSGTVLQASATTGSTGAAITLTATVSGISPTGSVSFSSGSTSLGTASVSNGTATLQTSFANAGSYAVTATYSGDQNNSPSTSNAVTISIAAPNFTIGVQPASSTMKPGQTATFTFTVTPIGGYTGTIKFACGSLPSEVTCSFSPASVTPANGAAATTTLTVTTTAGTAKVERVKPFAPWIPTGTLALAGILGLAITPRKARRLNRSLRATSGLFLLAAFFLPFAGCSGGGGGSSNNDPSNPGTPQGSYTISVNAADSTGGPQHTAGISISVQ